MFKVESYVTPILLSYVDKYVRDFKPADAQVSLWGGGVALHNLVLKADVLQQELALPFTLVSGRIHELLIQVPWTKIMSEPIVVTINTIECVLSDPPDLCDENTPIDQPRHHVVEEAPPGYMQALVRRIVGNISVRVNSLIVKYAYDDVVLSLNVKRLSIDSVGPDWEPAFTDIETSNLITRRLVRLDDLTLCLDRSDSDGKIRHYQEPLLYRCQLEIRLMMSLQALHTRALKNLAVQVRSCNLEWGVTSEQIVLLSRLVRERPQPRPATAVASQLPPSTTPTAVSSTNALEPTHAESWTDWAWSWMPSWTEPDDPEEAIFQGKPFPIMFSAFFDKVTFVYKVADMVGGNRKRARPLLELTAGHAVVTYLVVVPTLLRVRIGARTITLSSQGKCVCGHLDYNALKRTSTVYVKPNYEVEDEYEWPEGTMDMKLVDPDIYTEPNEVSPDDESDDDPEEDWMQEASKRSSSPEFRNKECVERVWFKLAPVVLLQYEHERQPPDVHINPYENPPRDFENSDWLEKVNVGVSVRPMAVSVSTGLLHRIDTLRGLLHEMPPVVAPAIVVRPLTVEECDALTENTPERKIRVKMMGFVVQVTPWDHSLIEQPPAEPLATIEIYTKKINIRMCGPLYPIRVCAAACQMPDKSSKLYDMAYLRLSVSVLTAMGRLGIPAGRLQRPIFKFTAFFRGQYLLNRELFGDNDTVFFCGNFSLPTEMNIYMTPAAMETVVEVLVSLYEDRVSTLLRDTSLTFDAFEENDTTAVDGVFNRITILPRICKNAVMGSVLIHSIKMTGVEIKDGFEGNVAWLFSAPDMILEQDWLELRFQYCQDATQPEALDYLLINTQVCAVSLDPLLMNFLNYRPRMRPQNESSGKHTGKSSKAFLWRRTTPPQSSSGRGTRSGSAAEFVHTRTRSADSVSECSERRDSSTETGHKKTRMPVKQWDNETILRFYNRLRHMMVRMNLGLVMLYTTASTASALETSSVQDAMERHATELQRVLVFSCGRWDVRSSGVDLSEFARFDKPTLMNKNLRMDETFPWKIKITAISSYTLETSPPAKMTEEDRELVRTFSQSRTTIHTSPCIILESLQSSMTISVVSKTAASQASKHQNPKPPPPPTEEDQKKKYFTGGIDFTPMTLRDFVRGPTSRPAPPDGHGSPEPHPEPNPDQESRGDGPLVSLGVCIHGDTPPARLTLRHDQIHIVRAAVHCLAHMWALLKKPRTPLAAPKSRNNRPGSAPPIRTVAGPASEQRSSSEETPSENPSERLIPIFESRAASQEDKRLKTFIWFQWVFSRVSVGLVTDYVKITMVIDDAIATIDLQDNYEQFRLKISTGTIYHYVHKESDGELDMDVWVLGEHGGRVLETREPLDGKSVNFFSTTVTRARFSNLPASWREDLTSKRNRKQAVPESMSEMFISMAPLEVILHPDAIRGLTLIGKTLLLNSFCPVQLNHGVNGVSMPFLHVDMGGMRVILNNTETTNYHDDTLVLNIGSITVLPYPDNPICRRSINTIGEANWASAATGSDGRQHELIVKGLSVRTAKIKQVLNQMAEIQERSKRNVNPAANWAEPLPRVVFTPILHNVDVHGVYAPPMFVDGKVACGPAFEVNISNDVNVEISFEQILLLHKLLPKLYDGCTNLQYGNEDTPTILDITNWCPFSQLVVFDEDEEDDCITESTCDASDSGVEPLPRRKKRLSVPAYEKPLGPFELMEVFLVMGRIDAALYVRLDRNPLVQSLKLPPQPPSKKKKESEPNVKIVIEPSKPETSRKDSNTDLLAESKSLTEDARRADVGRSRLNVVTDVKFVRRSPMYIPVMHVTLNQPNMYYWRKRNVQGSQMSLFNAWVALGEGQDERRWHQSLLETRPGVPDPETDIPPSLASVRFDTLPASSVLDQQQWAVQVDIERPVIIDINEDSLQRIKSIIGLFGIYLPSKEQEPVETGPLNKIHQFMTSGGVERVCVSSGQVGVRWTPWTLGAAAARVQLATARHPARLSASVLLDALLLSSNKPASVTAADDQRHVILRPLMFGVQAEAAWKPSVTGEHSPFTAQPTIRVAVEMDDVSISVRPVDTNHAMTIYKTLIPFFTTVEEPRSGTEETMSSRSTPSRPSNDNVFASHEVYYKDDLRSGAFKIMSGEQARMPMAYEVSLRGSTVVWHYPVPRFIARITALPLPDCDEEIDCVLESFNHLLGRWEAKTYFQIPVNEKKEYRMNSPHNDKIFAQMWRVRLAPDQQENREPFEFQTAKYKQDDSVVRFNFPAEEWAAPGRVTAEQLAGALRVDSYLSAKLATRMQLALRFGALAFHAHTAPPPDPPVYPNDIDLPHFEGIFVTPALRRAHRALSLVTSNTVINVITSACHKMLSYESHLGVDIYESETGTLEPLVGDLRVQGIVTYADKLRIRVRAGDMRVMVNAPRVRTLRMMLDDWSIPFYRHFKDEEFIDYEEPSYDRSLPLEKDEVVMFTWNTDRLKVIESAAALDGRVYLYVVNTCDTPLRFGQEGTDEVLMINARTTLAYRWNSPLAPKRLRFSVWGTGSDFFWSSGLPYVAGFNRVRLMDDGEASTRSHDGVFLYANVEDAVDRVYMNVGGRIVLGNMLKDDICYKIRIRDATAEDGMRVIASGDLRAQSIGVTVLCSTAIRDVYLKIKFENHPSGWTGDIPLKECPKEHVPWLVKVPAVGEVPCVSVWCRVERTRADNRIAVSVHPMFIMCSHLPLDIDVVMTTDPMDEEEASSSFVAPVLTQPALGRGHVTQLKAFGTTTVRHTLTFHYKSVTDCKVTQDTVPLHYGLTESSVFETHAPPPYAEDIVVDMLTWLNTSSSEAEREWPYSPVRLHWPGLWRSTDAQPRCDVLVRYYPVRCGGGGCGLAAHVMSRVLVANAAAAPLTLRAANAAPVCRVPPGAVSAPPADILTTSFYLSIDEDNCANLSDELCLSREEPGVYGTLPPGHLAVDRTTDITIHCDDKVAFLTLHYTMKLEMHIFGVTCTYLFINKLKSEILISPTVIHDLPDNDDYPILRPKYYQKVKTCHDDLKMGVRINHFWMCGRYVREEVRFLRPLLCFALPDDEGRPADGPVPVQLGLGLPRRSIAVRDRYGNSVAIVVTQTKHEGRWVITAAEDPCPQFAVHNHTNEPLTVAHMRRRPQHLLFNDEPVMREVLGVKWWYVVEPGSWSYYSTMTYMEQTSCAASNNDTEPPHVAHLTLGRLHGEFEPEWSAAFIVLDGEHLVQLTQDLKIKVKVHKYPHSTKIDLLNIDNSDVSASEIRQRLVSCHTPLDPEEAIIQLNHSGTRLTDELKLLQKQWKEDNERSVDESEKNTHQSQSQITEEKALEESSAVSIAQMDLDSETSLEQDKIRSTDKNKGPLSPSLNDWLRAVVGRVVIEVAHSSSVSPLVRASLERVAYMLQTDSQSLYNVLTIGDFQVDNTQHDTQKYDFAVVASTSSEARDDEPFPALWGMLMDERAFDTRIEESNVVLRVTYDRWNVCERDHQQMGELDVYVGPMSLYVEDAFVREASLLARLVVPQPELTASELAMAEIAALRNPLRLRLLNIHQLDLTLTLHTAIRLYIAVDRSRVQLSSFKLENMVTTPDKLMHDLTVHYLSGAMLAAGWVVGGLELLGAPGSLAARVAGARGGLRGLAAAAAGAVLRSIHSCAGSLARNLDMLAGDDDHTQRAAAARRVHPPTFMAGISAGVTNFAVNMLGAVGGLAHHPLVGLAVGEASGAAALRRGLVGALAKPLSATADLLAFAGQGLLSQTGWDPDPQQRKVAPLSAPQAWRRDCVRWGFRLHTLPALHGVDATLDDVPVRLVVTDKFLVIAEPSTERIVEMIDYRFCKLVSFDGQVVEICVTQRRPHNRDTSERNINDMLYPQASSAAMARVARFTGVGRAGGEGERLRLRTAPHFAPALAAALAVALRQDRHTHFALL